MPDDIKQIRADIKKTVESLAPEIYTLSQEAEVLALNVDDYTIDVRVLDAAGAPDVNWPVLEGVKIPKMMCSTSGASGGYFTIETGCIVGIGFRAGDINRPYLDSVIGASLDDDNPDLSGIYWMFKTRNTRIGVTSDRRIFIESEDAAADITLILNGTKIRVSDELIELGELASDPAAREGDVTLSSSAEDSAFWAWLAGFVAVFTNWVVVGSDGGGALKTDLTAFLATPAGTVPTQLEGIINSGSDITVIE